VNECLKNLYTNTDEKHVLKLPSNNQNNQNLHTGYSTPKNNKQTNKQTNNRIEQIKSIIQ